jgi:predicted ferric reductase
VLFAIYRKQLDFKYETWRLMHGLGAGLIAVLLLHHAVSAGRYGSQPVMTWVWVLFTGVALVSLAYVYLIEPVWKAARPWRVERVTQLTSRQWELSVTPDGHEGLTYRAGQFAWLSVGANPFSFYENPFSISSAPASGATVSFMIKELGDFTGTIGQIEPGTIAYLDGAFGNLTVDGRDEPGIALIAGGIGLAPLIGILRQMRLAKDKRPIRVLYGNRSIEQITCREELDREDVHYFLSEPPDGWQGETGLISPDALDRLFAPNEMRDWLFVICGPGEMMETIESHLIARGAPADHVLSECFSYD